MTVRDELVAAIAERYRSGLRWEKARILDEFVAVRGYHRKHAMRLLRNGRAGKRSGPRPFLDEPDDALVADPVLQEADDPFLGNLREERPDIGVENEIHLPAGDPDDQRVQRVVLAAPWPEPVREPEELLLVDRAQHRRHRPLDDLVFGRGDRERTLAAVFLRDVDLKRGPGDIGRRAGKWAPLTRASAFTVSTNSSRKRALTAASGTAVPWRDLPVWGQ